MVLPDSLNLKTGTQVACSIEKRNWMRTSARVPQGLDYLKNKPKRINWVIFAGEELHPLQMYDLVFDEVDMKIRKLV